jgi:putative solute:sodium symporter small subunit
MASAAERLTYWRRCRQLTAGLTVLWLVVGLGVHFFARDLNFVFFGWPFSFWMASQGSLLIFVLLIGAYAWCMERLDQAHGLAEEEP